MLCKLSQSEAQSLEIVKVNKVYIEVLSFKSGKFNGWINQNWGNGQKMKFVSFFGILTSLKTYVQLSIKLLLVLGYFINFMNSKIAAYFLSSWLKLNKYNWNINLGSFLQLVPYLFFYFYFDRGDLTVNYTRTQTFINTIPHSLRNFYWLEPSKSV